MRNGKKTLITVCGTDGSGKSTLCKYLINELNKKEDNYKLITWNNYFLLELPVRIFRVVFGIYIKLFKKQFENNEDNNKFLNLKPKNKFYIIFALAVFIDDIIYFNTVLSQKLKKSNVISDRYIIDRIVGFRYYKYIPDKLYSYLLNYLPQPDITFILTVSPKIAQDRETADKHKLYFYNQLNGYYRELKKQSYIHLDTKESLNKINNLALNYINRYNRNK